MNISQTAVFLLSSSSSRISLLADSSFPTVAALLLLQLSAVLDVVVGKRIHSTTPACVVSAFSSGRQLDSRLLGAAPAAAASSSSSSAVVFLPAGCELFFANSHDGARAEVLEKKRCDDLPAVLGRLASLPHRSPHGLLDGLHRGFRHLLGSMYQRGLNDPWDQLLPAMKPTQHSHDLDAEDMKVKRHRRLHLDKLQ